MVSIFIFPCFFRLEGKRMGVKLMLHRLIILVATIPITSHTFAEPLGAYCISQIGQKPPHPKSVERTNEPIQVTFTVQGKSFRVVAAPNSRHLLELIGEGDTRLAQVWTGQGDYGGGIESLVLGKNGWLWVDGSGIDYVARIDFSQMPPVIGKPIQVGSLKPDSSDTRDTHLYFSSLMQHPCSYLFWLFGCLPAQGYYSPSLNRAFVTGYPVSFFGLPHEVSYEIFEGQLKRLPEHLQGATPSGEVNLRSVSTDQDYTRQNGVIFRGIRNEALFYDGVTVTSLLEKYRDQTTNTVFPRWEVSITPANKRVILKIFSNKTPRISELMPDLTQRPIIAPDEVLNDFWVPFDFPQDPRLYGITRHSVLAEIDGALRTVVTIRKPWIMWGSSEQALDGSFMFTVGMRTQNDMSMESREYYLIRASPNAQCLGTLDVDHPFELWVE